MTVDSSLWQKPPKSKLPSIGPDVTNVRDEKGEGGMGLVVLEL